MRPLSDFKLDSPDIKGRLNVELSLNVTSSELMEYIRLTSHILIYVSIIYVFCYNSINFYWNDFDVKLLIISFIFSRAMTVLVTTANMAVFQLRFSEYLLYVWLLYVILFRIDPNNFYIKWTYILNKFSVEWYSFFLYSLFSYDS